MNQKTFIDTHIENILKDEQVKRYFDNAKSEVEKDLLKKGLEQSLETAYNSHAKDYFESKGWKSYVSKALRWTGLASNLAGTYMFWALGGAGFGLKGAGAVATGLAELIDNQQYEKYKKQEGIDKYVSKDGLKIATEGAANMALSYLPVGGEIWAFYRGTKKYDNKIVNRALEQAKGEFIKKFGDYKPSELKLVPLEDFADERYRIIDAEGSQVLKNAA